MSAFTIDALPRADEFDPRLIYVVRAVHPADLHDALAIRQRVFADEQGVADLRVSDPDDARSLIALARIATHEHGRQRYLPAATGRLTPPPVAGGQAQVAWVATLPELRGRGIGRALMRFLLDAADASNTREVVLAAQAHAEQFYLRLGFVPVGPLYDVRGIPHLRMVRRAPR